MNKVVISARIEGADRTSDEFKRARREVYRRARRGIKAAGEKSILPHARRETTQHSPVAAGQVIVKTTTGDGFLTAQTVKQGRKLGLLNYGGTVRDPIKPKRKKQAVAFGGVVVAQVNTARVYHGTHFLEKARDEGFPEYERLLLTEVMRAFDPDFEHTP